MKTLRKIVAYLDGSMPQEEKDQFESSIRNDKQLEAEVNLHREVDLAIREDDISNLRSRIDRIIRPEKYDKPPNKGGVIHFLRTPVAVAIIICLSLTAGYFLFWNSPMDLYAAYYQPYEVFNTTRSADFTPDPFDYACLLYQEGDYANSYKHFQHYSKDKPEDVAVHFYLGLSAMELEHYDAAIKEFQFVESDASSPFSGHAQWYLALSYLKIAAVEDAKYYFNLLAEKETLYSARAKKIRRKL